VGSLVEPLGLKVAYTPLGIFIALVFIGLPFTVRTIQPLIAEIERELEEASATLGASRWRTLRSVLLPPLLPGVLTGFALALARAYLWSGRIAPAADIAAAIAREDPDNAELPLLAQAINRARNADPGFSRRPLMAITQSLARVSVAGTRQEWADTIVTLAVPLSARTTLSTDLERENRAGIVDVRGQLRLDRRFAAGVAYVAVGVTPDADFRERWGIRVGGELAVAPMLILTGDVRYTDFDSGRTVAAEPGVRVITPSDRWSIALRSINLWDDRGEHRSGWALRGEVQLRQQLRLIAGGAPYPDTEAGITRRLRSGFAGAILSVSDDVVVRVTYEHEDRRESYIRDAGVIGISVRF